MFHSMSIFFDCEISILKKLFIQVLINFTNSTLRLYITCLFFLFTLISRQKEAEIISEILLRAASEPDFRNLLIKNSAEILEKYKMSINAKSIIKKIIIDFTQYWSIYYSKYIVWFAQSLSK